MQSSDDNDNKIRSLQDKRRTLKQIETQLKNYGNAINQAQKDEIIRGKTQIEKAIKLLENPDVSFEDYKQQMGIFGGTKKSRSKKSKKSRSKKSRSKKSRRH